MAGTLHLSPLHDALYALAQDEQWEGDVQAPTGAWAELNLTLAEQEDIARVQTQDFSPHHLILENNHGQLEFRAFATTYDLRQAASTLEDAFDAWAEGEEV